VFGTKRYGNPKGTIVLPMESRAREKELGYGGKREKAAVLVVAGFNPLL